MLLAPGLEGGTQGALEPPPLEIHASDLVQDQVGQIAQQGEEAGEPGFPGTQARGMMGKNGGRQTGGQGRQPGVPDATMQGVADEQGEDSVADGQEDQQPDQPQADQGQASGVVEGHGKGQCRPRQGEETTHRGGPGGIDVRQQSPGDAHQKEDLRQTRARPAQAVNPQGREAAGGGRAIQM